MRFGEGHTEVHPAVGIGGDIASGNAKPLVREGGVVADKGEVFEFLGSAMCILR